MGTTGIKINGIISVTVNMSTRNCVFYATKESVRKTLAQSLRIHGFQVQTEDEKENDDVASVHSGVSSMTDQNKAQLSSLMHDKNIQFTKTKSLSSNSIIKERYNEKENNTLNIGGPTYINPHSVSSQHGITRYKPKQRAMSIAQRLEFEQKLKEDEEKKQEQTQSLLSKFVAYIW